DNAKNKNEANVKKLNINRQDHKDLQENEDAYLKLPFQSKMKEPYKKIPINIISDITIRNPQNKH
ncbi:hypothetical protein WA026_016512, partial [Henosepilachna vigintioctopunctata]